jgi:hypothetical protein
VDAVAAETKVGCPLPIGHDCALNAQYGDRMSVMLVWQAVTPARALGRLRDPLAVRRSDDGVWFDSRAWIVTARPRQVTCAL